MTPCKYTILIFTICAIICSCKRELDKALSNAGNNRSELVKVLDHFKNDPDPLKYKSAVFHYREHAISWYTLCSKC